MNLENFHVENFLVEMVNKSITSVSIPSRIQPLVAKENIAFINVRSVYFPFTFNNLDQNNNSIYITVQNVNPGFPTYGDIEYTGGYLVPAGYYGVSQLIELINKFIIKVHPGVASDPLDLDTMGIKLNFNSQVSQLYIETVENDWKMSITLFQERAAKMWGFGPQQLKLIQYVLESDSSTLAGSIVYPQYKVDMSYSRYFQIKSNIGNGGFIKNDGGTVGTISLIPNNHAHGTLVHIEDHLQTFHRVTKNIFGSFQLWVEDEYGEPVDFGIGKCFMIVNFIFK